MTTSSTDLRAAAAFYRAGVASGIVRGADAVGWADRVIASAPAPPTELFDVSLAPPSSVTALVDALRPLAGPDALGEATARALLDVLRRQLAAGEVTPEAAIAIAYHMTRGLEFGSELWREAMMLEEYFALAKDGVVGDTADMSEQVRAWLGQFAGEADAFFERAG